LATRGQWPGYRARTSTSTSISSSSERSTRRLEESELRALVDDATEHCPACQAIRGNVAMQVTPQFDAV